MADKKLEYVLSLKDLFSKTMLGATKQTEKLDSNMNKLKNSGSKLGSVLAGAFSVGAVVTFGKAVIESLKNYEYFHASLKTMLNGNKNAANALESQLVDLAKTTPFELTEVQTATKQLLAYGFKAGDVVKTMRTLGDVSSGIGAPLGDIAYLYGTLKTSGRVTLMDLRQFAGRGIPIYEVLAKRLKTTTNEINKMVSAGKIGFSDIEGAFKDMTKEGGQFFNLMEDQSKTVGGQLSNMGDAWEQLKVNIGKSQTGIISSTISFFSGMLSSLEQFTAASNRMEGAYKQYGGKGRGALSTMSAGLSMFTGDAAGAVLKKEYAKDDEYLQRRFVTNSKTKLDALQSEVALYKLLKTAQNEQKLGNISKEDLSRKEASIRATIDQVKGLQSIYSMKDNPNLGGDTVGEIGGANKGSSSLGTGVDVTGNRPQSLNITINDGLVKEMNINTTNMNEGSAKVKEMVGKALIEAVNDVNLMKR